MVQNLVNYSTSKIYPLKNKENIDIVLGVQLFGAKSHFGMTKILADQ